MSTGTQPNECFLLLKNPIPCTTGDPAFRLRPVNWTDQVVIYCNGGVVRETAYDGDDEYDSDGATDDESGSDDEQDARDDGYDACTESTNSDLSFESGDEEHTSLLLYTTVFSTVVAHTLPSLAADWVYNGLNVAAVVVQPQVSLSAVTGANTSLLRVGFDAASPPSIEETSPTISVDDDAFSKELGVIGTDIFSA